MGRARRTVLIGVGLLGGLWTAGLAWHLRHRAPVHALRLISVHPHDPAAFTEGLVFNGTQLLESSGRRGHSDLRALDPASGRRLRQRALPDPQAFGEGVAALAGSIYQLTWKDRRVYVYDASSWALTRNITVQGEGWGLTSDGRALIQSDGSAVLAWRDPTSWQVVKTLTVHDGLWPVTRLNELEWTPQGLYANVWGSARLARIDMASGRVLAWLDLTPLVGRAARAARARGTPLGPEDVANGVAWDPHTGHLWITGKRWPLLFRVASPNHGQPGW